MKVAKCLILQYKPEYFLQFVLANNGLEKSWVHGWNQIRHSLLERLMLSALNTVVFQGYKWT